MTLLNTMCFYDPGFLSKGLGAYLGQGCVSEHLRFCPLYPFQQERIVIYCLKHIALTGQVFYDDRS